MKLQAFLQGREFLKRNVFYRLEPKQTLPKHPRLDDHLPSLKICTPQT